MPITKRQFELGIDATVEGWMEKVYDFLLAHKEQAYAPDEIRTALGVAVFDPDRQRIEAALETLAELGGIEARKVQGTRYFSFRQALKKGRWEIDYTG